MLKTLRRLGLLALKNKKAPAKIALQVLVYDVFECLVVG